LNYSPAVSSLRHVVVSQCKLRQMPGDSAELLDSLFKTFYPTQKRSGLDERVVLTDRICAGIPKLLNLFATSFPLLSLFVIFLSLLLILIARAFLRAAFSRRHSDAGERS